MSFLLERCEFKELTSDILSKNQSFSSIIKELGHSRFRPTDGNEAIVLVATSRL